jgi:uncharacterized protein YjbI with pentapeptide repeats
MTIVFYSLLITLSAFSNEEVLKDDFINLPQLDPKVRYVFDSNVIHKLFLKSNKTYFKLAFSKAKVVNFQTKNSRIIDFQAVDTDFYSANMVGKKIKKCILKNVNFYYSDLSFSDFTNCKKENVNYINTVTYGTRK